MAFPHPYQTRLPIFPRLPQQPGMPFPGQKFGFFSPQTHPPSVIPPMPTRPTLINMNVAKNASAATTAPTVPITTVFVGNITERCSDELMQNILRECGAISSWKRMQDSNGKYKAFGFCDFEHPEGTLRALRVLGDYCLGDRRLTVKTDENTTKMLEEFTKKNKTGEKDAVKEEKKSEDSEVKKEEENEHAVEDEKIRAKIRLLIESVDREMLRLAERLATEEPKRTHSRASKSPKSKRRKRKSRSSSAHRRPHSQASSHGLKKKRLGRSPSSGSSSSDGGTSRASASPLPKRSSGRRRTRSRSASADSEDSVEKRRLKKEIKEKEESYLQRLRKWEERERKMGKQYTKDEEERVQREKMLQREAKKLRQFLEDYEDERDDPKYYKSSSLFQRRRNYEREREADTKDRIEEQKEIEELKRMIMEENKNAEIAEAEAKKRHEQKEKDNLKRLRSHSGSPTPHRALGKKLVGRRESSSSESDDMSQDSTDALKNGLKTSAGTWETLNSSTGAAERPRTPPPLPAPVKAIESPSLMKVVTTLHKPASSSSMQCVNGVFGDEEEEEDTLHQIKKKIKPFEITREDRIQSMTPEERKKMIKDLIERIPTVKDALFAYTVFWEFVDPTLVEQRVKPWVNKKICEYIGEEEPSLVSFICERIAARIDPRKILQDLSVILDDEAEVFMVKLWRLIIYESEAKKLGLSQPVGAISTGSEGRI